MQNSIPTLYIDISVGKSAKISTIFALCPKKQNNRRVAMVID